MGRQVIWTPRAEEDLQRICRYLSAEWGSTVLNTFLDTVDGTVERIRIFPHLFRSSGKADVREALITKHNLLFYRVTADRIFLLTIWDTRRNPESRPFAVAEPLG
mgnify:CR=1 FL=1